MARNNDRKTPGSARKGAAKSDTASPRSRAAAQPRSATPAQRNAADQAASLPPLAQAMLEAHVAFWLERISSREPLEAWMRAELDAVLADAAALKLKEVVSPAQIKAVARRYAVELDLKGGIPELVASIGRELFTAPIHAQTRLGDILPERHVLAIVDKLLELEDLRAELIRGVARTPFYAHFAADLLYRGIRDYVAHQAEAAERIPGAGSMMKLGRSMLSRARPDLESSVEHGLKKYIDRTVAATASKSAELLIDKLDAATLRGMLLEIWQGLRHERVADLTRHLAEEDFEELFVLGYAAWGDVRASRWIGALLDAGIDAFFARYGRVALTTLLDDLGISREMMVEEGIRFAPPVIATLAKKGLLEPLVRRQLEPFYASPAVAALLAGPAQR